MIPRCPWGLEGEGAAAAGEIPKPYERPQQQWLRDSGKVSVVFQESRGSRAGRRVTKVHLQGTGCSSELLLTKATSRLQDFSVGDGPSSPNCSWDSQSCSFSWEDFQFPSLAFSCLPV